MGSERPKSSAGGMTEARKEKLMDIQKREQLKGMLINKFKLKYGDKPQIGKYIDNEVARFLKNDRLTEANLQGLDTKINKECQIREKKSDILSQRSGSSKGSRAGKIETLSAKSVNSLPKSQAMSVRSKSRAGDNMSQVSRSTVNSRQTDIYSEINEEDEWFAIQKFNTLLHYEEQKQAIQREKERKRLIKEELDAQMRAKGSAKQAELSER